MQHDAARNEECGDSLRNPTDQAQEALRQAEVAVTEAALDSGLSEDEVYHDVIQAMGYELQGEVRSEYYRMAGVEAPGDTSWDAVPLQDEEGDEPYDPTIWDRIAPQAFTLAADGIHWQRA